MEAWPSESSLLKRQLDFISQELETIDSTIRQMDETTKNIKQWTAALWTAALGFCLGNASLEPYTAATGLIPLMLMLVEASYRRVQRRFIWRSERIGKFLAGHDLMESFSAGKVRGLRLWDPSGVYSQEGNYQTFISHRAIISFPSVGWFYVGLALLSLGFGIVTSLRP